MAERLQKLLAAAGIASRRAAEAMIRAGRVRVNGQPATLGMQADPAVDQITVDGQPLPAPVPRVYFALHKPRGVISTVRDPQGRPTVLDLVPPARAARAYPVGRLDQDSEGLLLLTNDGALTRALLHPSHAIDREYLVEIDRPATSEQVQQLAHGVPLDSRPTARADVTPLPGQPPRLRIILREGRKRQIRLMCAAVGLTVRRLRRVRFGPIHLGTLAPGHFRPLQPDEIAALKRAAAPSSQRSPRPAAHSDTRSTFSRRQPRQPRA